jgi:hypothetical protein
LFGVERRLRGWAGAHSSLKVFDKFTEAIGTDDASLATGRRNRALALFEDDFEMRRQGVAPKADATLRLQQISTMLIREGSNGALYQHVLGAAIELMSADMGSMQVFYPERGDLRLLVERGFHPASAA